MSEFASKDENRPIGAYYSAGATAVDCRPALSNARRTSPVIE